MSADVEKLVQLRPGMPVSLLVEALGDDWKEPDKHAEGRLFHGEFCAQITADGKIGEVAFSQPIKLTGSFRLPYSISLDLPYSIYGVSLGMEIARVQSLFPDYSWISDEREEYGWRSLKTTVPDGFDLVLRIREGIVGFIVLRDPKAIYTERPYKYADETLTQAFDLTLADPVRLSDERPEFGWCFGRPPGIDADGWPLSPRYGIPLRHAFTLKLPPPYRTLGIDYVAISLFVDEQWRELPGHHQKKQGNETLLRGTALARPTLLGRFFARSKPKGAVRFDMEFLNCRYVLVWLTEAEFAGPLGTPPDMSASAGTPEWLERSPIEYVGEDNESNLPVARSEQNRATQNRAPGGYGLDQLLFKNAGKAGWKYLVGAEALDFGWPIEIMARIDDPNAGKPARELDSFNALSGYVKAYSDRGQELGLDKFEDWDAHLGGTMIPIQGYPDFSPFYIEFNEAFGGFNFGGGRAQLDLKEMAIDWAC